MNYSEIAAEVIEIAKEAGAFIRQENKKFKASDIEHKGKHDYVTYVDKTAERMIVERLQKLLPEAGYITEENTLTETKEHFNWIVDPLDGTTNFLHHLPPYSVSIALKEYDEIVAGVVYEINLDECFSASKNGGAYLNNEPISVTKSDDLDHALLVTGFPYTNFSRLDAYMDLFHDLMKRTGGIRRLGSAAVDLAYVACGRFEAFYEYGLKPWDVAAGALIVKEAGGKVSDFKNETNWLFGQELVATNGPVHEELVKIIDEKMN